MNDSAPYRGWIFYDGSCRFCYWLVHFWESVVNRHGFQLKDLQSAQSEVLL